MRHPALSSLMSSSLIDAQVSGSAVETVHLAGMPNYLGWGALKEMVLSPNLLINPVSCRALPWTIFSWGLAQGEGL